MNSRFNSLESFLEQRFGLSGTLEKLSGGLSHEVLHLNSAERSTIIKIYDDSMTSSRLEAEEAALELISANNLISAPKFIRGISGSVRESFSGRIVSCYEKISGEQKYSLIHSPTTKEGVHEIGSYLALLHQALLPSPLCENAATTKKTLLQSSEYQRGLVKFLYEFDPQPVGSIIEIEKALIAKNAPRILIHGDFQQANLIYLEDQISGIIDFEYSTYDYRILEIAGTLSNLLSSSEINWTTTCIDSFLKGYESSSPRQLLAIEKKYLEVLIYYIWKLNLVWVDAALSSKKNFDECSLQILNTYREQTSARLSTGLFAQA